MSNEKKYIQLPPIERTVDARVIQTIWAYARLPEKEKKQIYDDLKTVNGEKRQLEEITSQNCENVEYSQIEDFEKTMGNIISGIIEEACDLACWVYCKKYIEKMTLEEMIGIVPAAEKFIFVIDTWFNEYMIDSKN